jgi:hypothetical protein
MKKILLILMITSLGLVSCTKEETITPQSNQPAPINYGTILKDNLWNYVLIEHWLFMNDYQIQSTRIGNSSDKKIIEYKLFNDSLVIFFKNPMTSVIEPVSYPNLTFVNDTLYYQRTNRNKQWLLFKRK